MSYLKIPSSPISLLQKEYPAKYKYHCKAQPANIDQSSLLSIWKDQYTGKYYLSDSYKVCLRDNIKQFSLLEIGPAPPTELMYRTQINNPVELTENNMRTGFILYENAVWSFPPMMEYTST